MSRIPHLPIAFALAASSWACNASSDDVPFLLAPGVTGNDLVVDPSPRVLVAGDRGFIAIDGQGNTTPFPEGSAVRMGVDAGGAIATIGVDGVATVHGTKVPDAVDIAADCDGWWIARGDQLGRLDGTWKPIGTPHAGIVGVAPGRCGEALVWSRNAVWWASSTSERTLWTGEAVHAAAYDGGRTVAIAAGDPPALTLLADGRAREVRLPSTPRAMAFGTGGLLPAANLYLLEDNAVSFLRPERP